MAGEERANWIAALEAELNSLIKRDVKDYITTNELYERYWPKGKQLKRMPSKVVAVKKPTHAGHGG